MQFKQYVEDTYELISPFIRKTPLLASDFYNQNHQPLLLKCENLQHTHSFKVRGAFSKIARIKGKKGKIAIAASAGNHGLGVSFAAAKFGMKAIIVVPEFVSRFRIELIQALGAEVVVHGKTMEDLYEKVAEYTSDLKYVYIHPFDDDDVIAGQATVAYEILQDCSDIEAIVVAVGGGGLISGIAKYAKSINPHIKIYGVQTIGADAMTKSLQAGEIVSIPRITSIATSLGATRVAQRTFDMVKEYVEKVVTVSDEEAIRDLKKLLTQEKLLVEPASSCTLSAIFSNTFPEISTMKTAVVLCGGNFSLEELKTHL